MGDFLLTASERFRICNRQSTLLGHLRIEQCNLKTHVPGRSALRMDRIAIKLRRKIYRLKAQSHNPAYAAPKRHSPRVPPVVSFPVAASPVPAEFQFAVTIGPLARYHPFFRL
jgi:hypothetical protein